MIELSESKVYEFEEFRLHAKSHRLFRRVDGELVPLTPKAVELLLVLVESRGQILSKDELLDTVWGNSFVEESNLSQTIFVLRKTLGENTKEPRFILTAPNRGYQFIAPVKEIHSEDEILGESFLSDTSQVKVQSLKSHVQSQNPKSAIRNPKAIWLSVPLLLLIAFGVYWFYPAAKLANLREIKTIAILPFEDLSAEQTDKYLGVSLADALANKFSGLNQIVVRPTRTVAKYAESHEDASKIGRELQVDAVLDGRIQRVGDRIRISVQLIRTADNATIWTENFDDQFTNIFVVQDSISQKVVQSLALQMNDEERERFNRHGTENAEAYQDYLRGRYFLSKRVDDNLRKAITHFEKAIQKDPNFALGFSGLARAYSLMPEFMGIPTGEAYPKAKEYATRAIQLDEQLAEVHVVLGYINYHLANPVEAEKEYRRAIELNPNDSLAHLQLSRFFREVKKLDESMAEVRRASELDPVSVFVMINIAQVQKGQGDYDAAIEQLNKTLAFDPNFAITHDELARVLYKKGLYAEALIHSQKAVDLSDRLHTLLVTLCEIYIKLGERQKALGVIRELEEKYPSVASYYIALLYAQLGDREKVFVWLERAIKEQATDLINLKDDPNFDPYRHESRFQELLRRIDV